MLFPQGCVTCYTSGETMTLLADEIPTWLISIRSGVDQPASSGVSTPCYFFFRGYFKSKVYNNKPNVTADLIHEIRCSIDLVTSKKPHLSASAWVVIWPTSVSVQLDLEYYFLVTLIYGDIFNYWSTIIRPTELPI